MQVGSVNTIGHRQLMIETRIPGKCVTFGRWFGTS